MMTSPQSSRDVNVREALASIRSTMTNAEVMEKFKITPAGFADLLKQLFTHKLISEQDLVRRGIQFKIVSSSAEVLEQPQPIPFNPSNSGSEEEEFLDTLELTKLLSFEPPAPSNAVRDPEPDHEPQEVEPPPVKKGKLGISNLFRKTW